MLNRQDKNTLPLLMQINREGQSVERGREIEKSVIQRPSLFLISFKTAEFNLQMQQNSD